MRNISRGDVELLQVVPQLSFIQRAFEIANLLLPSFGKLSILLGESSQFVPLCVELFGGSLAQPRVLQARASGLHGSRLFLVHVLPNLKPVLYAQFWISIPVFILAEANLGILGLGVAEPLPSWGSLLRELEGLISFREEPWRLVPLVLLIVVMTSFQTLLSNEEVTA